VLQSPQTPDIDQDFFGHDTGTCVSVCLPQKTYCPFSLPCTEVQAP
jgi:hypothetical protein